MIGWLWRIIVGRFKSCDHKWVHEEEYKKTPIFLPESGACEIIHVLRCERCGDMKNHRVP